MPISLLPQKKEHKGPKEFIGFIRESKQIAIASAVFILVLVIYGGSYVYVGSLNSDLKDVRIQEKEIQEQRQVEEENAILAFNSKVASVASLLNSHIYFSRVLEFVEGIIHPRVQILSLDFESGKGVLSISAVTQSYDTFGEQIIALRKIEQIQNLKVANIGVDNTGKVKFDLSFGIDQSLYR